MTDKERIIIDGLDVNKCKHFCLEQQIPDLPLAGFSKICGEEYIAKECKNNSNCYFKQLARKTQECEELKKKLMQKDEINTFLNAPIGGWSNNPCDICESKNNYEQLKQECEELKEDLKRYKGVLKDTTVTKIDYLQESLANQNKADRYRKALEEIEEEIKKYQCDNCEDYHCASCDMKDILNIINETKGE